MGDLNGSDNLIYEYSPAGISEQIKDPEMYLTSLDFLNSIKPMDAANDIIGIVTVVHDQRVVKDRGGNEYLLFKFLIKCDGDYEIPVTAWDEDISRIKPLIKPDYIIHFDGVFARSQDPKYSDDGKLFVFTVRSNTRVNTLDLQVYIKSNGLQLDGSGPKKRIGLLTDLKFKTNIVIFNFEDERVFEQGQKIGVRGKMNSSAVNPTLNVEESKDIEIIKEGENVPVEILRKKNKFPKYNNFEDETKKEPEVLEEA
ncbi:hypothetical protein QAD02_013394 [Eretmocerus hayati]|uniref:Uncharacterized protein n=1 Tax=Eretmocerus hayati TaxID=131215 RepID=A0ACC2P594_9HYME|nr:hypothetical protein QAD02_013394 [Eretmocerus hayati]